MLRRRLTDQSQQAKLSGLIRYCSLKGIKPANVNESGRRRLHGLQKGKRRHLRSITKRDERLREPGTQAASLEGWPQQELIEPPLKPKEGPSLGRLPRPSCKQTSILI